jgi:DNA-binding GntR family transcriptional regulator
MTTVELADQLSSLPPLGQATSQSDLVAEAIRAAILAGQFKPDEVLVERRLAAGLGVSKTPVREALIMLSNSGLVTMTRNRGVAVRRMTRDDARHVYEQRLLLEPWAVASAIRLGRSDFTEAQRLCAESQALAENASPELVIANRKFHRALYVQCENRMVVATLDRLQDLTALATLGVFWQVSPTWHEEQDEHRDILQAAVDRKAPVAERLMHKHIRRSLDRIASGPASDGLV